MRGAPLIWSETEARRDAGICVLRGRNIDGSQSYHELRETVSQLAAALRRSGIGRHSCIPMVLDNTLPAIVALLAAWEAGASVASLPPPPSRRANRFYREAFTPILSVLQARVVVGTSALDSAFEGTEVHSIPHEAIWCLNREDLGGIEFLGEGSRLIQFTSGSLGAPKGIAISPDVLRQHAATLVEVLELDAASDKIYSWLPLYHDMGLIGMFLLALASKVPLLLSSPGSFVANPRGWVERLIEHKATVTCASDFAYRMVARLAASHGFGSNSLQHVRLAISGGERVQWATLEAFHRALVGTGFHWESLLPAYGMAEATLAITVPPLGRGPILLSENAVSVGPPIPGVEVAVSKGADAGSIRVKSPWLCDFYVTSEGPTPRESVDGWFDTRDAGAIVGGELAVEGRVDNVIMIGGRNVFPEDVEATTLLAAARRVHGVMAFRSATSDRLGLAVETHDRQEESAEELAGVVQRAVQEQLNVRVSPVVVLRPWTLARTTSGKIKRAKSGAAGVDAFPSNKVLMVIE